MRRLYSLLFGIVLAGRLFAQGGSTPAAPARPAAHSADERELYGLEDGWAKALVRRDRAYFERSLAPGYVYTDERGVTSRGQLIKETLAADDSVQFAANEDMQAHVYDATGVVTGVLVTRGHNRSGPYKHRYRFTDTWIKRDGRWVMVASQDYDIPHG